MRWIHQTPVLDGRLMRFLLLPLLLLPLTAPALAQMKFVLKYQDQFGWASPGLVDRSAGEAQRWRCLQDC